MGDYWEECGVDMDGRGLSFWLCVRMPMLHGWRKHKNKSYMIT